MQKIGGILWWRDRKRYRQGRIDNRIDRQGRIDNWRLKKITAEWYLQIYRKKIQADKKGIGLDRGDWKRSTNDNYIDKEIEKHTGG